jgi:uncharacterized protein YjbI with pentapeptide repeats
MFWAFLFAVGVYSPAAHADIFRWDNEQLIPGTEGVTPGPDVQLPDRNLEFARLAELNLTGANFRLCNLTSAHLFSSTLTNANLSGANLASAELWDATLTNASLTGAIVAGARLYDATNKGLTKEQIYSTASYQAKDLGPMVLTGANLSGWDLSRQNLAGASLSYATLTDADLSGAVVTGARLVFAQFSGLTKEQLYSTASYQSKNLRGVLFIDDWFPQGSDLSGWDFNGQNLTGAGFSNSTLENVDFSGAIVTGALFNGTTSNGFTKEQLYSTASYQAKNLGGIWLGSNDLTGWDFGGQDLTRAYLGRSTLASANFAGANVNGAYFSSVTENGFTKDQFYLTANYQAKNLQEISLDHNDLSHWDFSDQNLTYADLQHSQLSRADLTRADLRGVDITPNSFSGAIVKNTIALDGRIHNFHLHAGETLVAHAGVSIPIKLQANYVIEPGAKLNLTDNAAILEYSDASPIADLREQILAGRGGAGLGGAWTGAGITSSTAAAANVSQADSRSLGYAENATFPLGPYTTFYGAAVGGASILIAFTRTGDANLDGVVNDDDVTIVGATYAPGVPNASWALGDFDYNGFVDDDDVTLLNAFYDPSAPPLNSPFANGGSSLPAPPGAVGGLDTDVVAVPEPSCVALAFLIVVAGFAAIVRPRVRHWFALVLFVVSLADAVTARADIFRWDNGQLIPGTEGIVPGPGVQLNNRELEFADLRRQPTISDLSGANLSGANLSNAWFHEANLSDANLSRANLTAALFATATLTNADLTGALVTGTDFAAATARGFTKEQLYSTASYQSKNLTGIILSGGYTYGGPSDLSGWDLRGQDLTDANLSYAILTNADLSGAIIKGVDFSGPYDVTTTIITKDQFYSTASYQTKEIHGVRLSTRDLTGWDLRRQDLTDADFSFTTLTNANLTGAIVTGVNFSFYSFAPTSERMTREQLYSTASYQAKNLAGVGLAGIDLSGSDFREQNLTGAMLSNTNLTNANLTGAIVKGADFGSTTSRGFTRQHLYSTRSYQAKDLTGVGLSWNDLSGWNFSEQNLTDADLYGATLTNANLTGAIVTGANFAGTPSFGLTREQLYSTASYQARVLLAIRLYGNDLSGWDFSGQNLTGAHMYGARLTNTNLSGANLTGADFSRATLTNANLAGAVITEVDLGKARGLTKEQLYSTASYQAKDLRGIRFGANNMTGWDFSGQNLANAHFTDATLTNTDLAGAIVTGTLFENYAARPGSIITKEQLYSTASYRAKNLHGISLTGNDLSGWDFSGQNLTGAWLAAATITNANLTGADTRGAYGLNFAGAITTNVIRPDGRINGLNLAAGERLVAYAAVPIPVKIGADFSIAPTGTLDLTDNAAIVDYTETNPAATVREHIRSGRGGAGLGGKWTGTGITSSTAAEANKAAPDSRSLGYADNAAMPLGPFKTFHGASMDDTSILIALTRTGDANLDGVVDDDDVTIVGATYAPGMPQPSWALGDFNYNGFVDDDDVTLLGAFYDPSAAPLNSPTPPTLGGVVPSGVSAVPEPSTVVLAGFIVIVAAQLRVLRLLRCFVLLVWVAAVASGASVARAAIYRWDNRQVIPGTEGIHLEPWVSLSNRNLAFADLNVRNLPGVDFTNTNLTNASVWQTVLTNAILAGANVTGTRFFDTTRFGLTKEQIYSTSSYQAKNLRGIGLDGNDLTGWSFSGQNLAGASFFHSTVSNVDFTGAILTGTYFGHAEGFTKEQLYSTASYQAKDLRGFNVDGGWFPDNFDLTGWDLSGQNLSGANFSTAVLTDAKLTGANLTGADLGDATLTNADLTGADVTGAYLYGAKDLTREQFYSTKNYQEKTLQGIGLSGRDLRGWNFNGQNLAGAFLDNSNLDNANLASANLTGAWLVRATLVNANVVGANLTRANLTGSNLADADLTGADFRGAVYTGMKLDGAVRTNLIAPDGRIVGLNLAAGEKLVAYAGVPIPLKFGTDFSIAPTATFDLTDNAAIVDYTGPSPAATVREQIFIGRGGTGLGGKWRGTGITSSTAAAANSAAPDSRSLGFADNATMPLGAYTTFRGEPVDNTTALVAYTRTGDANLDGVVNDDDVTIVSATYAPGVPQPSWALGDFDYNGFVDDDDVTLLNAFYDPSAAPLNSPFVNGDSSSPAAAPGVGASLNSGVAAVPEPSTVALALIFILAVVVRTLTRRGRYLVLLGFAAFTSNSPVACGDIFRWDNGQVIPGTEGIVPGPGLQLTAWNLQFADLEGENLTGATSTSHTCRMRA